MYRVEMYARVRRACRVEGMSTREASRVFGLDRKTVRKMLSFSVPPGYRRGKPPRRPKLGPFTGIIDRILEDDRTSHHKQRHTAKRIFDRLRDEYGFTGGYTIVKDYVRERRLRSREMFVPLVHSPGHAQADFGEAMAVIGGVARKIHFLAFDLPHSDACFVKAYPAETPSATGNRSRRCREVRSPPRANSSFADGRAVSARAAAVRSTSTLRPSYRLHIECRTAHTSCEWSRSTFCVSFAAYPQQGNHKSLIPLNPFSVRLLEMYPVIQSFLAGFPVLILHTSVTVAMLVAAIFVYIKITPYDELKLIRGGNTAAAVSLSGAIIGLALPLAFSMASSISVWEVLIWGPVTLALQLIAFRVTDIVLKDLPKRIVDAEMGPAILLVSIKLATATINAAAVTG